MSDFKLLHMKGLNAETVKVIEMARKYRRDGWGYSTILSLVKLHTKMSVTRTQIRRWVKDLPRGDGPVYLDDLIAEEVIRGKAQAP